MLVSEMQNMFIQPHGKTVDCNGSLHDFFGVPVMGEKCKDIIIQSNIGERKQLVGGIPTPLKNDGVRQWVSDDYSHI